MSGFVETVRYSRDEYPGYGVVIRTRIDSALYLQWQSAHRSGDFSKADKLRATLAEQGVKVHVKKDGGYGWTPSAG